MSIVGGFFNAKNVNGLYDRVYNAEDFAAYFANFIRSGVFAQPSNQMKVVPGGGLSVDVSVGKGYIKGYWVDVPQTHHLTVSPNMTGQTEQIKVVCKIDFGNRVPVLEIQENVESLLPENEYELVLATFSLQVGESEITTAMITDRRPDETYCGFVTGLVDQIDFTELMSQQQAQFNEWFNDMKDQLSEDAAGNLQQQIDDMEVNLSKIMLVGGDNEKRKGMIEPPSYGYGSMDPRTPYFLTNVKTSSNQKRDGWVGADKIGYYMEPVFSNLHSYEQTKNNAVPVCGTLLTDSYDYEENEDEQGKEYAVSLMNVNRYDDIDTVLDYEANKLTQYRCLNWGHDIRYKRYYTKVVMLSQNIDYGMSMITPGLHYMYTPIFLGFHFYNSGSLFETKLLDIDMIYRLFDVNNGKGLTWKFIRDIVVNRDKTQVKWYDATAKPLYFVIREYTSSGQKAEILIEIIFDYAVARPYSGLGFNLKWKTLSGTPSSGMRYDLYGMGGNKMNCTPMSFNLN